MRIIFTLAVLFCLLPAAFAQKTYIPDSNFEEALIFEGLDNVLDDSITTSVIDTLTFLDLEPFGIVDLTGIEDFAALEIFICRNNNIVQVDLSNNPFIEFLNCENNNITSIDVTNCSNLREIRGENNNLTSINLTQNLLLEDLELNQNGLGSINLDNNIALKSLRLVNTALTSIDVSNNTLLENLDVSTNQLSVLDVTDLPNLVTLNVTGNSILQLDLSNNPDLDLLLAAINQLTTLDLINNPLLTYITCMNNNLESLILPPAGTITGVNLGSINNPDLICITSDNPAYVNANWNVNIDSFTTISTLCTAGIAELGASIEIFPNPTTNGWVSVKTDISGDYELFNLNGAQLQEGKIVHETNLLDFSTYSTGMYILKLKLDNQIITKRIELL